MSPWQSVGCFTWALLLVACAGSLQLLGLGAEVSMCIGVVFAFAVVMLMERRNRRARVEEMREANREKDWWT